MEHKYHSNCTNIFMRPHIWFGKSSTTSIFMLFVIMMVNSLEFTCIIENMICAVFRAGIPYSFFRRLWIFLMFLKEILNYSQMFLFYNFVYHVHSFYLKDRKKIGVPFKRSVVDQIGTNIPLLSFFIWNLIITNLSFVFNRRCFLAWIAAGAYR